MGKYQIYVDRAYDAIDRRAYADAMRWCRKATDHDPSAPDAYNARGEALDASGMWEEALQAFDRALERDSQFVEAILNKAEILADRPETCDQALPLCDEAAELCDEDDLYLLAELGYIRANALQGLFRYEEALEQYEVALELVPNHPDYLYEKAVTLYCLVEYEKAEDCLRATLDLDPGSGDAQYTLGLLLEKTGRDEAAAEAFATAFRLDPARHPLPLQFDRETFETLLKEAVDLLPEPFALHVSEMAIRVEEFPSEARLLELGLEPQVLGTLEGEQGRGRRGEDMRLTLYQRNLEKMAGTDDDLREQIRLTVMHEVGHFIGLSEQQLRELGVE